MSVKEKVLLLDIVSNSVEETKEIARNLAKELKAGDILTLYGDLGAGKTHFVKGVASAFQIDETKVHSPTFTLVNEYQGLLPLYHFDCYRLKNIDEVIDIGFEDYVYSNAICCIEWPDLVTRLLPESYIRVSIDHLTDTKRHIIIEKIDH